MKDRVGRNINYLRISVTDRCNLRCRYCMPEEGVEKKSHGDILSLEEIYEVAKVCSGLGINKIRLTGGEPLIRKGLTDLVQKIASLDGIEDIALTTNGQLLGRYAQELRDAGLHRVNISLDTLDREKYKSITRGGSLEEVLSGMQKAKEAGLGPIKLNTVLIGGFNDDEIKDFVKLTLEEDIDVRFIELMPIGQAAKWTREHFIANDKVLEAFPELEEISSADPSSPAHYYRLQGAKGKVGLINPISHKFCCYCNRLRLTADGKLKPCLHSNQEIDVKAILREDGGNLMRAVIESVWVKPQQHNLDNDDGKPIDREMFRIGG